MKTLFKLFFAVASFLFTGVVFSTATEAPFTNVLTVMGTITAVLVSVRLFFLFLNLNAFEKAQGLAYAVNIEFWDNFVASNLYKGYEWMLRAKNRSQYVNGDIVHIPQAGIVPNVVRNRANYPLPVVRRADTDIIYKIDELSSDTTFVKDAEKWELSYSKVPDIIMDHRNELGRRMAQNVLYRWGGIAGPGMLALGAANIVRTTGGAATTLLPGATGNRNAFLVVNLQSAKTILINQTKREISTGKRAFIMTEDSYTNLLNDSTFNNNQLYDKVGAVFKDGDLKFLLGFEIIRTDVMPRFTGPATPIAKDSLDPFVLNATTDNDAILAVDFDFIHIAPKDVKLYYDADNAEYQGDILNGLLRMGASRERLDQAGVVAIVQG